MLLEQLRNPLISDQIALDDLSKQHSWQQVANSVAAMMEEFRSRGLEPGDHVALLMTNCVEYIELIIACLVYGLWVTPVNWHLARQEILYILDDCGARLLITDEKWAQDYQLETIPNWSIDELSEQTAPLSVDLQAEPGGVMMYTSGTTGHPKGVKRTKLATIEATLAYQVSIGMAAKLDGSGPHLVTGPLYHAAPMMYALMDMGSGAPLIIMPRFDAGQAMMLLRDRGVHHTHWVPTMFIRALSIKQGNEAFPDLHLVLHGAAPIAPDTKRQMIDWWGPILEEYWGGTESGIAATINSEQWLAHPGAVGRALPQFDIYCVDDNGARLPAGEQGMLCIRNVRNPKPFIYHHAEQKTADSYREGGGIVLGDIGLVDEEGYIFLLDRDSNMIISGGVNIYPAEVEAALISHPDVADVAVFGIPDPEWGEQVKAVVELLPGGEAGAAMELRLMAHIEDRIARYKWPRSIDFIDELPRFSSGKLYVRQLKAPYWQTKTS